MCLTNFSGHILSMTAEMLTRVVVAITKGERYETPSSHLLALAGRPVVAGPSAGTSAGPSSSLPPSTETPTAHSPADPSTKVSLQMQKDELVKVGYDKDYISRCDETAITGLLDKEAAKEQPAKEPAPAKQDNLIRSWI